MTEKEIKINGFEKYLTNCSDCNIKKQLKRKEEECEELLKFNNSLVEEHKTIGNDLYKEIKDYRKKLQAKEQECEELKTEFDNFEKQIKLQGNFIDSFLNATNNSEWLNKSILEDEADAIIEKVESDYVQLKKFKQALQEIKEIAITGLEGFCPKCSRKDCEDNNCIETAVRDILQKCEVLD